MEFLYPFKQPVHPLAVEVCRTLWQAGYQAYIVGGCVRDLHLGLQPKDWDITSDASPEQVIKLFEKTIPTGLQHGTVTVCMGEGVENHFEVTTFRVEGEYRDGRRPESVQFVRSLTEDLARRDFTINAMAFSPVDNIGADPFNGHEDIKNGVIRAVGSPQARFQEDGLRIMRAARFAARFSYQVDMDTLTGMKNSLDTLQKVSKERISDELCKILMTDYPSYGLTILYQLGALHIVCPLLMKSHPTFSLQDACKGDLETRLALLYHGLPSKLVEQELMELKLSNKEVKRVIFLLLTRASFLGFQQNDSVVSYRKFIARLKNEAPDDWEYTLQQFISFAEPLGLPVSELLGKYQTTVYARKDLAVNGNDFIAAGVKPGPNLKILLDSCYSEILEHPEHNNKEFLLRFCLSAE